MEAGELEHRHRLVCSPESAPDFTLAAACPGPNLFVNPAEVGSQPPTVSNAPASAPKSTSRRRTENDQPWRPH